MAGEFTAGLSGGQRKLLLFELIYQRIMDQKDLLVCLDEPFCGVTDDFLPFILERLTEMKAKHNVLLVTNDHVKALSNLSDNVITVSAIDREHVSINEMEKVDRGLALQAMSKGNRFEKAPSSEDLQFFWDVEIRGSAALMGIFGFTTFCSILYLLTFWDSTPGNGNEALIMVANQILSYFYGNPYLLSLVDWRIYMLEEAEALVHNRSSANLFLKTLVTLTLIALLSVVSYGMVNAVITGFESINFLYAMFFDAASLTITLVCCGLYTNMSFEQVQIFGSLPFLLMIFFSTTFSPGAGVEGVKVLRYLFARFYFWCMVPGVEDEMENCPSEELNMLYLILSGVMVAILFLGLKTFFYLKSKLQKKQDNTRMKDVEASEEFKSLQEMLYRL